MTELYRPSNGEEGEWFYGRFCYRCAKYGGEGTSLPPCLIQGNALFFGTEDPKYPQEWCYDDKGEPQCTAFDSKDDPKVHDSRQTEMEV